MHEAAGRIRLPEERSRNSKGRVLEKSFVWFYKCQRIASKAMLENVTLKQEWKSSGSERGQVGDFGQGGAVMAQSDGMRLKSLKF